MYPLSILQYIGFIYLSLIHIYPQNTAGELYRHLDRIAKAHQCTMLATGMQEVFWLNMATCVAGGVHHIDAMEAIISYNAEEYGKALSLAHGVGLSLEEFRATVGRETEQMRCV